jgi:hypothetical protein
MTKFKELADHFAASGIATKGTITKLRRLMREAGLLRSGGQGNAARDIAITDVTNLFLGLVAADQLNHAPGVISLCRAAAFNPDHSENCHPWPFTGITEETTLGEFLDRFFEGVVHSGIQPEYNWTNMSFEFDIVSGEFGCRAALWFDDGAQHHNICFNGFNSDTLAEIEQGARELLPVVVSRVATVRDEFLRPLADFTIDALFPGEGEQ